jgi:hypothetical protein
MCPVKPENKLQLIYLHSGVEVLAFVQLSLLGMASNKGQIFSAWHFQEQ